jgi:hypothetical protein
MKEILTEEMLREIVNALMKGETYDYSDDNTDVHITPNGISIQYQSQPKEEIKSSTKDQEVTEFIKFCDRLTDDLFIEVCDSFQDGELDKLQRDLNTDNYRNTIKVFTIRAKEIANNKLNEIINACDVELKRQEEIIRNANAIINDIHSELDRAHSIYSI